MAPAEGWAWALGCGFPLAVTLGLVVSVQAQDEGCAALRDPGDAERRVELSTWSEGAAAERLERTVGELLSRLEVRYCRRPPTDAHWRELLEPPSEPQPALARAWVAREPDELVVLVVDGPWQRAMVRRVPTPGGVDEVVREEVGHIVYGSVEALLQGRAIGMERERLRSALGALDSPTQGVGGTSGDGTDPDGQGVGAGESGSHQPESDERARSDASAAPDSSEPPPTAVAARPSSEQPPAQAAPAQPAPKGRGAWTELGLGYVFRFHGGGKRFGHELGLAGLAGWDRGSVRWLLGARGSYRLPATVATSLVRVRTSGVRVVLETGIELPLAAAASLRATVGPGLDVTFVESAVVPESQVVPRSSSTALQPVVSGRLALHQHLAGPVSALVGLDVTVDTSARRYRVQEPDGRRTTVWNPWRARLGPWVALVVGER